MKDSRQHVCFVVIQKGTFTKHIGPCDKTQKEVVFDMYEYDQLYGHISPVFQLINVTVFYRKRLGELHSTRLAQKLQQYISTMEVHHSNTGTVLTFNKDIGDALLGDCHADPEDEAIVLMRMAKLLRNEIFEKRYHFDGSCVINSMPAFQNPCQP